LVHFSTFWHAAPRKIWQPWSELVLFKWFLKALMECSRRKPNLSFPKSRLHD
jgi:hypothetical protein